MSEKITEKTPEKVTEPLELDTLELDTPFGIVLFILNIAKNIIGSFILFLPFVYNEMGLFMGVITTVIVYFLSVYSFCVIAYFAAIKDVKSYSGLFSNYSRPVAFIVDLTILLTNLLSNSVYIIFISISIDDMVKTTTGEHSPISKPIMTGLIALASFPVSSIKTLHNLRFISFSAFIAIVVMVISGIVASGTKISNTYNYTFIAFPHDAVRFLVGFPILAGFFDCHTNALEYYREYIVRTKNKDFKRFVKIIFAAFGIVLLVGVFFSVMLYVAYGTAISDNPVQQIESLPIKFIMYISIIFSLFISYSQFLNPIRISLHNIVFDSILQKKQEITLGLRLVWTMVIVLSTFTIAAFVDSISYFTTVSYSITGSLIIFIYPILVAMHQKVFTSTKWKVANIITLIYGIVISFMLGFGTSVYEWVQAEKI